MFRWFGARIGMRPLYDIRSVDVINISPADVIVLKSEKPLTSEAAAFVKDELKKVFGQSREVIVLDEGIRLSIISHREPKDAAHSE